MAKKNSWNIFFQEISRIDVPWLPSEKTSGYSLSGRRIFFYGFFKRLTKYPGYFLYFVNSDDVLRKQLLGNMIIWIYTGATTNYQVYDLMRVADFSENASEVSHFFDRSW